MFERIEGVGVMDKKFVFKYVVIGLNFRVVGVFYDVRKDDLYYFYD